MNSLEVDSAPPMSVFHESARQFQYSYCVARADRTNEPKVALHFSIWSGGNDGDGHVEYALTRYAGIRQALRRR